MTRTNPQRGYTLIELLLVMSVAVVLMLVNVGLIHQTMKFASQSNQQQHHHRNLTRLAWEFRDDVRECTSLSMDGSDRLILAGSDGITSVSYSIGEASLDVERSSNGSTFKRESFRLDPKADIYFDESELPDWISLVVARQKYGDAATSRNRSGNQPGDRDSSAVDLHVRASPNRWGMPTDIQRPPEEEPETLE